MAGPARHHQTHDSTSACLSLASMPAGLPDVQPSPLIPAGICPYDKVVCLVVDECHKATGKYDIVTAVKKMQAAGCKFRVLGLSATPGNTVDAIQVSCTGAAAARKQPAAMLHFMVHARVQELFTWRGPVGCRSQPVDRTAHSGFLQLAFDTRCLETAACLVMTASSS